MSLAKLVAAANQPGPIFPSDDVLKEGHLSQLLTAACQETGRSATDILFGGTKPVLRTAVSTDGNADVREKFLDLVPTRCNQEEFARLKKSPFDWLPKAFSNLKGADRAKMATIARLVLAAVQTLVGEGVGDKAAELCKAARAAGGGSRSPPAAGGGGVSASSSSPATAVGQSDGGESGGGGGGSGGRGGDGDHTVVGRGPCAPASPSATNAAASGSSSGGGACALPSSNAPKKRGASGGEGGIEGGDKGGDKGVGEGEGEGAPVPSTVKTRKGKSTVEEAVPPKKQRAAAKQAAAPMAAAAAADNKGSDEEEDDARPGAPAAVRAVSALRGGGGGRPRGRPPAGKAWSAEAGAYVDLGAASTSAAPPAPPAAAPSGGPTKLTRLTSGCQIFMVRLDKNESEAPSPINPYDNKADLVAYFIEQIRPVYNLHLATIITAAVAMWDALDNPDAPAVIIEVYNGLTNDDTNAHTTQGRHRGTRNDAPWEYLVKGGCLKMDELDINQDTRKQTTIFSQALENAGFALLEEEAALVASKSRGKATLVSTHGQKNSNYSKRFLNTHNYRLYGLKSPRTA